MLKNLFKSKMVAAMMAVALSAGFASCSDDDDPETTLNPAEQQVANTKKNDTALLLCTFGSTYNESLSVYDDIIKDYAAEFPGVDIYMSFTSRTCINRVQASTVIARNPGRGVSLFDEHRYQEVFHDSVVPHHRRIEKRQLALNR